MWHATHIVTLVDLQIALFARSKDCEKDGLFSENQFHVIQLSLRALRAQVNVCGCLCVYTSMYVHVYVRMYIYVCIVRMYVYVYTYTHIYGYIQYNTYIHKSVSHSIVPLFIEGTGKCVCIVKRH